MVGWLSQWDSWTTGIARSGGWLGQKDAVPEDGWTKKMDGSKELQECLDQRDGWLDRCLEQRDGVLLQRDV